MTRKHWLLALVALAVLSWLAWMRFAPSGTRSSRVALAAADIAVDRKLRAEAQPNSAGDASAAAPAAAPATGFAQILLRYGNQPGELGLMRLPEMPPLGPESFAVADDGSVLIADAANERISIFGPDGAWRAALSLPGCSPGDVTVGAQGQILVYEPVQRRLHQFDADGRPRAVLQLNAAQTDTRGYFHVVGENVYFADAAARDVLVAVLRNGVLSPPDDPQPRRTEGIHGRSGRVYSLAVERGAALQISVTEPGLGVPGPRRELPLAGLLSARFIGEDAAGRFYVQVETLEAGRISLGVIGFTPGGEPLRVLRVPENDYALWTAKLFEVQPDGALVQFLPQREQAKLCRFVN